MSKQDNILDGYEQKTRNCKLLKKHQNTQKATDKTKNNVRQNMLVLSSKSIQ